MAFLFKSKKNQNQDRALSSRDGNATPQGTIQQAAGRLPRDEKSAHRGTPTGSLNSIENDLVASNSPGHVRQNGSLDQTSQPTNDLAVSFTATRFFLPFPLYSAQNRIFTILTCFIFSCATVNRKIQTLPFIRGRNGD